MACRRWRSYTLCYRVRPIPGGAIAYETLIDVPAAARDGGIARLEYPLHGAGDATLQAMLYPAGRLNLARDWGSFMKALAVVDRIRWLLFR